MDLSGKVNQICCKLPHSHPSFDASFSGEFVVIAHEDLESFTLHPMHNQQDQFDLDLSILLNAKYNNPRVILPSSAGKNYSLNDNFLIANISADGHAKIIIFELDYKRDQSTHPVFQGKVKGMNEINGLQLGAEMHQNDELLITQVIRFKSGWIVTIKHINSKTTGSYYINHDGTTTKLNYRNITQHTAIKNLVEVDKERFYLLDYNGVISTFTNSEANLSSLVAFAQAPDEVDMQQVDGRLIFFSSTDQIYELADPTREDFINLEFVKLDTKGLEMTGINAVQGFNNMVYIATKSGLYMKSLKEFWTPESADQSQEANNPNIGKELMFKPILN